MRVYFLVEAELAKDAVLTADEIRMHLEDCAQRDDTVGFVGMKAWSLENPLFEARTTAKPRILHRDSQMLYGKRLGPVTIGATIAK